MLSKANMQIFGDPTTMTRMSEQFMRAASLGTAADGLMRSLPPEAQSMLERVASSVGMALKPSDVPHEAGANGNGTSAAPAQAPAVVLEAQPAPELKTAKRVTRDDRN
jgi:hypothetical protein